MTKSLCTRCFCTVLALFVLLPEASASECGYEPVCQRYWKGEVVFLGTADSAEAITTEKGLRQRVHFSVLEVFKGTIGRYLDVTTASAPSLDLFAPQIKQGVQYLVFASLTKDGQILIMPCSATRPAAEVPEEIAYLRRARVSPPRPMIFGGLRLSYWRRHELESQPLAGSRIQVKGPEETLEALTDAQGNYRIQLPSEGKYEVVPLLPDKFHAPTPRTVEVSEHACAQVNFETRYNGRIRGIVTDSDGRALAKAQVALRLVDDPDNEGDDEQTKEDGTFEFIWVQPGRYLLGVNTDLAPDRESPYPPTYYPGVSTPDAAAVLDVAEGSVLEGYRFRLQVPVPSHLLTVKITYADGRPANGAEVAIQYPYGNWTYEGKSDSTGTLTIAAYGEGVVSLRARVVDASKKEVESETVKLPLMSIPQSLQLRLPKPSS